jgi:co-chaperonin GroES (HSP10)
MIQGSINPTKILVREVEKKEAVTKSGIILTNIAVKDPQICGEIAQLGSSVPPEWKISERVLFYPHSAQKFRIDEDEVMLLDFNDVLFKYLPQG